MHSSVLTLCTLAELVGDVQAWFVAWREAQLRETHHYSRLVS